MDPALATLRNSASAFKMAEWCQRPAVAYYLTFGAESFGTTGDAHELADFGFTTTSLVMAGGAAADLPPADFCASGATIDAGTPGSATADAGTDLFQTPSIFADPMGFFWAGRLLGSNKPPRMFVAEFFGALTTDSANETRSGFGLIEDGGTAGTDADAFAWIYSNSANLCIRSGAANGSAVGPAVSQQMLLHRIEVDRVDQIIRWKTSSNFGATWTQHATLALEPDELPCAFGAYAHTTNRFGLYGTAAFYYI